MTLFAGHASSVVVPPGEDPQVVIYIRKKNRWLAGSCAPGGISGIAGGSIAEGISSAAMLTTLPATAPAKARAPTEEEIQENEERKEKQKETDNSAKRILEGSTVKNLVQHSISFREPDQGDEAVNRRPATVRRRNTDLQGEGQTKRMLTEPRGSLQASAMTFLSRKSSNTSDKVTFRDRMKKGMDFKDADEDASDGVASTSFVSDTRCSSPHTKQSLSSAESLSHNIESNLKDPVNE